MASNGFTVTVDDTELLRALDRIGANTQAVVTAFLKQEAMLDNLNELIQLGVNLLYPVI